MPSIDYSKFITEEELKEIATLGIDKPTFLVLKKKGYKLNKQLIEGGFGKVFSAYNRKLDCKIAVKVMDLEKVGEMFKKKFLPREIDALIGIKHDNVIYIHDIIRCARKMYIFMHFANGGDIAGYIEKNGAIEEPLACFWFTQVASALNFIHTKLYMAHRDIKIDNILLDDNNAMLTDFGFAKKCFDENTQEIILCDTFCGTDPYFSPQILARKPYDGFAADSWAMGVTLFCMLNNKFPFHFNDPKNMYAEMVDHSFIRTRYTKKFPKDLLNLQEKFFVYDEASRMNMASTLRHSWILRKGK